MNIKDFTRFVRARARFTSDAAAVKAVEAVLQALGERISIGQAEDLAAALPVDLRHYLRQTVQAQAMTRSEFLEGVAEREGTDAATAEKHCLAVLSVLGEWVPRAELRDTLEQLPNEMRDLFTWVGKAA